MSVSKSVCLFPALPVSLSLSCVGVFWLLSGRSVCLCVWIFHLCSASSSLTTSAFVVVPQFHVILELRVQRVSKLVNQSVSHSVSHSVSQSVSQYTISLRLVPFFFFSSFFFHNQFTYQANTTGAVFFMFYFSDKSPSLTSNAK